MLSTAPAAIAAASLAVCALSQAARPAADAVPALAVVLFALTGVRDGVRGGAAGNGDWNKDAWDVVEWLGAAPFNARTVSLAGRGPRIAVATLVANPCHSDAVHLSLPRLKVRQAVALVAALGGELLAVRRLDVQGPGGRAVIDASRRTVRALSIRRATDSAALLATLQRGTPQLRSLALTNCKLDTDASTVLAAWPTLPLLRTINLSDNKLGDAGIAAIVGAISQSTELRNLDVSGNKIGVTGAVALASLATCCSLESLSVARNDVNDGMAAEAGAPGTQALMALAACPSLTALDMSRTNMHPDGAVFLPALAESTTLETLRLNGNGMTARSVGYVAKLAACPTLRVLDLRNNGLFRRLGDIQSVRQALAARPDFRAVVSGFPARVALDLSGNSEGRFERWRVAAKPDYETWWNGATPV